MAKHNFGYFFHEGINNMFSHGFMTFATIGITVACLLIMGTFTLVAVNADANLKDLEASNEILAYVDDSYTAAEAKGIEKDLEKLDNVASATYISKEQAMEDFSANYPEEELFQDLDPEILRDRYSIKVKDLELQGQTVREIDDVPGIAKVKAYEEVASGFIAIRNVATVVCVALIVILFVVSVFITSNTIKLTTFDRREEIAIMRMVGATNGFIRWPFVFEGLILGGAKVMIRVGTCGSLQEGDPQGALYVATAACREEGVTQQLIPMSYPAVADHEVVTEMLKAVKETGAWYKKGIIVTGGIFYKGLLPTNNRLYAEAGCVAFENEAAMLFVTCSLHGVKAGCISAADGPCFEFVGSEEFDHNPAPMAKAMENQITVALESIIKVEV